MRNPKRIPIVCEALKGLWRSQPEKALAQIIYELVAPRDPYFTEEDQWMRMIRQSTPASGGDLSPDDERRINTGIATLHEYWISASDLRLGQIMVNSYNGTSFPADVAEKLHRGRVG